ncbi:TPA: hypothetical protein ACXDAY_002309 [Clostridium botulinum]|nr:hypothetical protein [Clostridium botulinum]APH20843.1 hypothetical protein NPD1_4343 [Clostridium botulinum]APQ71350.1 hypothetical protein RSJ8_4300 [Clostridium botulinum]
MDISKKIYENIKKEQEAKYKMTGQYLTVEEIERLFEQLYRGFIKC